MMRAWSEIRPVGYLDAGTLACVLLVLVRGTARVEFVCEGVCRLSAIDEP